MANVTDVGLMEFNAWMAGAAEYSELSPRGRGYCDEYLEGYARHMDALCEGSDA